MSVTYVYVNKEMMHKLSFLLSNYNWFWILYILTPSELEKKVKIIINTIFAGCLILYTLI
jgi:hypothetical protein